MTARYWLLRYNYVPDVAKLRPALRPEHLKLAQSAVRDGVLLLGGAMDPLEKGGVLVFFGERSDVENFVSRDPYVQDANRVVSSYSIDPWQVVVGTLLVKQ